MPVPVLSAGSALPHLNQTTKIVPLSKRREQVQRSDGTGPRSHGLEGVEPGYEPRWRCSRTQTLTPLGCLRPRAVPKLLRYLLLKDVFSWPSELAPLLPRLHNPKSSGFLVSAGSCPSALKVYLTPGHSAFPGRRVLGSLCQRG